MDEPTTIDWAKDLRRLLNSSREEHSWVTGQMDLELRSGAVVSGELVKLEDRDQVAVIRTEDGEKRVRTAEITNAIIEMASAGPE